MSTLTDLMNELQAIQDADEALRRASKRARASCPKPSRTKRGGRSAYSPHTFNSYLQAVISTKIVAEAPRALIASVKADDLEEAKQALTVLRLVGSSSDALVGQASLLATAIGRQVSVPMIGLLIDHSRADFTDHGSDAWHALSACAPSAWREGVESLMRKAAEGGN